MNTNFQRPNARETEDDLLKLQEQFLSAEDKIATSATISKRPDKRKNQYFVDEENISITKDAKEGSSLLSKKSKFKSDCLGHDNKKAQVAAMETSSTILANIVERDTKNEVFCAPVITNRPFPSVLPMSSSLLKEHNMGRSTKKSLFAQQVEAKGLKAFGVNKDSLPPPKSSRIRAPATAGGEVSVMVDGTGLSLSQGKTESQAIHHENTERLSQMSEQEILEEQKKLLESIDPKLLNYLRNKKKGKETHKKMESNQKQVTFCVQNETRKKKKDGKDAKVEVPFEKKGSWLNMDKVEQEKMEWMTNLPEPTSVSRKTNRPARFDFQGNIMSVDVDVPVNQGLHHHGDEPERAGYTLEELFRLARSSNLQQRVLSLHTIARIVENTKTGHLACETEVPIIPTLLEGGVVTLIRWSLDESGDAVVSAALDTLHSLVFSAVDQECHRRLWSWYMGESVPALTPVSTVEKDAEPADVNEENREEEADVDVVQRDVLLALVKRMDIIPRFCYILDTMKLQAVSVNHMIEVLVQVSRHSQGLAYEILKHPTLLNTIFREFLPTVWKPQDPNVAVSDAYGLPLESAVLLIKSLCQAGRNMTATLISKHNLITVILRLLAVEARELQLNTRTSFSLQEEALAVWRVCLSYGFASSIFFDLQKNILTCLGKMNEIWITNVSRVESEKQSLCWMCDSGLQLQAFLVTALTNFACIAGTNEPTQGQFSDGPSTAESIVNVDWKFATAMFAPIKLMVESMLVKIGEHYPSEDYSLELPVACINFMATYYSKELYQAKTFEADKMNDVEPWSLAVLRPFLNSFGFNRLVEHLSIYSNILSESSLSLETSANLLTLGVFRRNRSLPLNMPILDPRSPYGFLTALLRLVLSVCKQKKSLIAKLVPSITHHKDILMYLTKTVNKTNPPLASTYLTRFENYFHFSWLQCCVLFPTSDMSLAHKVALRLLGRVSGGDEYIAHVLMSTIIFNQIFIPEGETLEVTSDAISNISLSESFYLKSATEERINLSKFTLLSEAHSSLLRIRAHFMQAFGGMEEAIQKSRDMFDENPERIQNQMKKQVNESIMPKDWIFLPLIHVYNKALNSKSSVSDLPAELVSVVTSVLQFNYIIEMLRTKEASNVSPVIRLSRIFCVFLTGNNLFLEKSVYKYMAALLRVFTRPKLLATVNFEERIPGISSFYDFYQEILDQFQAVSFGDPVFSTFILLPLQQQHNALLRKSVWGERKLLLRTLRIPINEMLISISYFLDPCETDLELLQLYFGALVSNTVQFQWSPLLYLVAIHHVNRFLFSVHQHDEAAVCDMMWKSLSRKNLMESDIVYYKQADPASEKGYDLYKELPHSRLQLYNKHKLSFN